MVKLKSILKIKFNYLLCIGVLLCASQIVSAQINIGGISIPKIKREKTNKTDNKTTKGNAAAEESNNQDDVQTNPNAPSNYNANLNVGDQAVAVDDFKNAEAVKILSKSGNAYKVAKLKEPDSIQWYSLNSVYPYFDKQAFDEVMFDYKHSVTPYLECYGKKHNLDEEKVTVEGYNAFGARNFTNAQEAQKELQSEQSKLAELDNLIKSKFGGGASNTFLEYLGNPSIVAEIAAQRGEYLKCAVGVEDDKPDFRLSVFLDDIKKAQSEVDRYTPADFLYLVSDGGSSAALLRAVSPKAREEWSKEWLKKADSRAEFNAAWDELAKVAAKKIPLYKPAAAQFKFRYPVGEKLLMDYFKNSSTLKIFRTGTDTTGWDIQKDSSNFPTYRYKDVRVYLRDSSDDFPYCKVVTARVKQDYAGGGTYNPKVYRSSASEEIYSCP